MSGRPDRRPQRLMTWPSPPFTGNVGVPVSEYAFGVVAPGPDVELIMCRQSEAIRAVDELKQLAFEDWWIIRSVVHVPHVGEDDELHTDEGCAAVLELVNQSFWLRHVQDVIHEQRGVDEMH